MAQHKPWQFFTFRFTADDGEHTVSVGTADRESGVELIADMYGDVRDLQVTAKGGEQ